MYTERGVFKLKKNNKQTNSIFLIGPFFHFCCSPLFKQEGLSEDIQLIAVFLQSLTDDSTTTDDAGVNKQASPDAAGSNE